VGSGKEEGKQGAELGRAGASHDVWWQRILVWRLRSGSHKGMQGSGQLARRGDNGGWGVCGGVGRLGGGVGVVGGGGVGGGGEGGVGF